MSAPSIEQLLEFANQAAGQQDWTGAYGYLKQAARQAPDDAGIQTGMGACLVQQGQVDQAVRYFEAAARLAPDSADAHNNLGMALAATGRMADAEQAYRTALTNDAENLVTWRNLAQLLLRQEQRQEEGVQILASVVQSHPEDVETLLLLAGVYSMVDDRASAELLIRKALALDPENPAAQAALQQLPPAPERIARPEHAQKLAALKARRSAAAPAMAAAPSDRPVCIFDRLAGQMVALIAVPELPGAAQLALWARKLTGQGCRCLSSPRLTQEQLDSASLFVFSQPNLSAELLSGVNQVIQAGKPFAMILEQDYAALPPEHPGYAQFGPGSPGAMQVLDLLLQEAAWVGVPSPVLADRLRPRARQVELIPPLWDSANAWWTRPAAPRSRLTFGWVGGAADLPDLALVRDSLTRLLQELPDTALVLSGDWSAWEMFSHLPEDRVLYLPSTSAEDDPYLYNQFDVLLFPLRDTPLNQARSSLPLLQAGARGIPWVSSALAPAQAWRAGGILAADAADWDHALRLLAGDPAERARLAQEGRAAASAWA